MGRAHRDRRKRPSVRHDAQFDSPSSAKDARASSRATGQPSGAAVGGPSSGATRARDRGDLVVEDCLVVLTAALLAVGFMHHTVLRHVLQILPFAAAWLIVRRYPALSAPVTLPMFVFWLAVATLIWLDRLGFSPVVPANYAGIELGWSVMLTLASTVGCVAAIRATIRRPLRPGTAATLALFTTSAAVTLFLTVAGVS